MMNNYLEIELTPNRCGGGSFNCKADFILDNFPSSFKNIDVKIDTGCSISTIPIRKINADKRICRREKAKDIDKGVPYLQSYGVESGGKNHRKPNTRRQKMKCEALKFQHSLKMMRINGVLMNIDYIYLNYDRSGNILIGMDILKQMICHIDESLVTGKLTLLCCPREYVTADFKEALYRHFRIAQV